MKISIVLSTFNQPQWLSLALHGYESQLVNDLEIVIADDGSNNETRDLVNDFKSSTSLVMKHIWHPDNGFQKCRILNRAIEAADGEYLIFSDGDCIPREDFVEVHQKHSQKGFFYLGAISSYLSTLVIELQKKVLQVVNVLTLYGLKRTEFRIRPNY